MHLLRAEKGFIIVGQDTDATMTPIDLQMDWIVSKKKYDFIGKRSLYRSDTIKEDRKQLVGLLTENPDDVLEEGTSIIDIALGKSIATVSNARLIDGKPRPKTPFTMPAIIKTPTAIMIV